jgi:hypothetical protein
MRISMFSRCQQNYRGNEKARGIILKKNRAFLLRIEGMLQAGGIENSRMYPNQVAESFGDCMNQPRIELGSLGS